MMKFFSWLARCAVPINKWPDIAIHRYAGDCIQVRVKTFCWGMEPTRPWELVCLNGLTTKERADRIAAIADRLQARVDKWRINEKEHTKKFNDKLAIFREENAAREQHATEPINETLAIVEKLRREASNKQKE